MILEIQRGFRDFNILGKSENQDALKEKRADKSSMVVWAAFNWKTLVLFMWKVLFLHTIYHYITKDQVYPKMAKKPLTIAVASFSRNICSATMHELTMASGIWTLYCDALASKFQILILLNTNVLKQKFSCVELPPSNLQQLKDMLVVCRHQIW